MTDYEIYCDESRPELFVAGPTATVNAHAAIGSVWIPATQRSMFKKQVLALRHEHGIWGEAKWTKLSPGSLAFYKALVDLVLLNPNLRFRSIVIDARQLDLSRYHEADAELGFYKFYYQVLVHWLSRTDTFRIFCDGKVNRDLKRLATLRTVLNHKFKQSTVESIHSLVSHESVLIQICDVLLGAVQAKFNRSNQGSAAKAALISHIESRIGHPIAATFQGEQQFNIFKIQLQNGTTAQ